jgi:glutamyl-tRNA reductase
MSLVILGLNHKTAPVEFRERLAFGPDVIGDALRSLADQDGVNEAAILSTCNRTELYCALDGDDPVNVSQWLCDFHGLPPEQLRPYIYTHRGRDTVGHLLKVACGLDSMVLGEPQILGQVKTAYQTACAASTVRKLLSRLFQYSFAVAKQVRTDTAIGNSPVSVAFAAVSLARQIFSDLSEQTALLIGAGETIELVARHLYQHGTGRIIVANRTVDRAHGLACQFDGYAIALTEMPAHLPEADIVISSTASPLPVLGKGAVERALKKRRHRPMFMVDVAVPRDIEPEVSDLSDVYLYTVDDLEEVIRDNMNSRRESAEQAVEIIEMHIDEFMGWLRSQDAVRMIRSYRSQNEQVRDEVLERALRLVRNGKSPEHVLRFLAHTLTNKLQHTTSAQLRQAGFEGQHELLKAANALLQLKQDKGGA